MARTPWTVPVIALALGCAGGQTGEITMLGPCRVPVDEVALDAESDAGRSVEAQLADLVTVGSGPIAWEAAEATLDVTVTATGEPATVVGGEGCERPFLHVPVTIALVSDDGRLDERLPGAAALFDTDSAVARATVEADAVSGSLELEPGFVLRVEVELGRAGISGQLFTRPEDESEDDLLTGSF